MASTNKTGNLKLSQFAREDDPSWYDDYNADMLKLDDFAGNTQTDLDAAKADLVSVNAFMATAKADLAATKTSLEAHRIDRGNLHAVTAAQVGAATSADLAATNSELASHKADKQNPHAVTAAQVGAATSADLAATNSGLASHKADKQNPHGVTLAQVGGAPAAHTTDKTNPHKVTATQVQTYTKAEIDALLASKANLTHVIYRNLSPSAGFAALDGGLIYGLNQFHQLHIVFDIQKLSGNFTTADILMTLPEGCRPVRGHYPPVTYDSPASGSTVKGGIVLVLPSGQIKPSTGCGGQNRVFGSIIIPLTPY